VFFKKGVEQDEELAHDGGEDEVVMFSQGPQTAIELAQDIVEA